MIPYTVSDGEPPRKTYKEFQTISEADREEALRYANGFTDRRAIVKRLLRESQAANDNMSEGAVKILMNHELLMMLYCWVENNRDDVQAKLAFVDGRSYG